MVKYLLNGGNKRHHKFQLVSGHHSERDFVADVCFSTKKEAQVYAQSQRIDATPCRVIKERINEKMVYVPYCYGAVR
jgi:hypothetical protein